jgi:hypothetical protein
MASVRVRRISGVYFRFLSASHCERSEAISFSVEETASLAFELHERRSRRQLTKLVSVTTIL